MSGYIKKPSQEEEEKEEEEDEAGAKDMKENRFS